MVSSKMSALFRYQSRHLFAVLMLLHKPFKDTAHTLSDQQIKLGIVAAPAKPADSGIVNVKLELIIGGQVKRIDSNLCFCDAAEVVVLLLGK